VIDNQPYECAMPMSNIIVALCNCIFCHAHFLVCRDVIASHKGWSVEGKLLLGPAVRVTFYNAEQLLRKWSKLGLLLILQVAELSQRDRAALWVSFGQM